MSQIRRVHKKILLQISRVSGIFPSYQRRFFSAGFDSKQFINSCYEGQTAFRRREDEERTKVLITYVIARIKESMKTVEKEP